MEKIILLSILLFCLIRSEAQQSVGIGTTTPNASSILELSSTTKGFLPPRMTGALRALIPMPAAGLMVYQTDNAIPGGPPGYYIYDGVSWKRMARVDELGWTLNGTSVYTTLTGGVGIGLLSPNASAALDISSITKGLLIPRMTSAQRMAIAAPAQGLTVFQMDAMEIGHWFYDGSAWQRFAKASELSGSTSWAIAGSDQYSNVAGNVGIGVAAGISEKLTMKGDLFIKNESLIDYGEIMFQSQAGNIGGGGLIRFLEPDSVTNAALIRYRPFHKVFVMSNELGDDGLISIYDNGNIGIGTSFSSDAVSKLQVVGGNSQADYDDNGYIQIGYTSQENVVFGNNEILARDNGAASPLILQEEGGAVKIGNGAVIDTRLHVTAGAEAGLTNHGYMVLGSVNSNNVVMDRDEIQARLNGAASILRLQQDGGGLQVQGGALTVSSAGNVGIGDVAPEARLHVEGDGLFNGTNPTVALHNDGVQKGFIQLSGDNFRVGTFSDNPGGKFVVRTGGSDNVFVDGNGNMGIGTSNPLAKLDVAGRIRIDQNGEALGITGTNPHIGMWHNGSNKFYLQQLGNDFVVSHTANNQAGRLILGAAEVAINTFEPAPGYSLSVAGEIICEELRVELQGNAPWPDYVFAEDYNLQPLHELKSFIATNKHLPNIPAAAQVEMEGFDVGDMNRRLLEKVEELTLYIIQQQEQIDALYKLEQGRKRRS